MPINRIRLDDVDVRNLSATSSSLSNALSQLQKTVVDNQTSNNALISNLRSDLTVTNGVIDTKSPINNPTFTGTVTAGNSLITNEVIENYFLIGSGAAGTLDINLSDSAIFYYVNNATANWTFNFRASASVTLNNLLSGGQAITATILITNGGTAYIPTAFQVDGAAVTVRWADALVPASGNINSIDIYTFSILKTAPSTFIVLGSQARFA